MLRGADIEGPQVHAVNAGRHGAADRIYDTGGEIERAMRDATSGSARRPGRACGSIPSGATTGKRARRLHRCLAEPVVQRVTSVANPGAGDGNRTRIASLEGWNSSH